jgi:hypothetical protein
MLGSQITGRGLAGLADGPLSGCVRERAGEAGWAVAWVSAPSHIGNRKSFNIFKSLKFHKPI